MTAVHVSLGVALVVAAGCARTAADRPVAPREEMIERDEDDLIAEAEEREALPPAPPVEAEAGPPLEVSGIFIDEPLALACGIPLEPEDYLQYDSTAPEPEDNPLLRRLAECLTTGPLRGRKVEVRGHTDPRVSDEYGARLGMSRADSVRDFLTAQGVHPDDVLISPGDEPGPSPEAPSDWPYERHVHIVLLPDV
jgi:outer membrane protein OmpA-like peptidoglycan-associated protein